MRQSRKQETPLDARRDSAAPPPGPRTWRKRVQHVSLRTKIFVPVVGLAVLPAVTIGLFTASRMRSALRARVVQGVELDTQAKAMAVQDFLRTLHRDLRFLSQITEIRGLANAEARRATQRSAALRAAAERQLSLFTQGRRGYEQLRYLDGAAREVLRLDATDGVPRLVPARHLREDRDPYYREAAAAMRPGQIYISAGDPDRTTGRERRVLRCATPVATDDGRAGGLLVVNVAAAYFFSLIGPLPAGTEAWLVDERGMYLGYVGESDEKRARYGMASQRSLAADFGPSSTAAVLGAADGGGTLETAGALVSFAPLTFDAEVAPRRWTLLIAHPLAPVYAPLRDTMILLWLMVTLVVAVAAAIGLLVAHYVIRPLATLRRATNEIAAGNLAKHVEITTGDEIEGLAVDFNTMTERLREAHEQLSAWNDDLQREVARRTGDLQRLQAGFARADKLASLGQMTASIMHEIGNPLAAIKTKIQVAEERGALEREHGALLPELVKEVDRLTVVLRSYSRLGRLRSAAFTDVQLDEVVREVVTLVTPDLRKRDLTLRVRSGADVPGIRGDPDQLRQLLINVILNAAEASPDGGTICVTVARAVFDTAASPWARVEITDHGTGISAHVMEKIWEPFFTTKPDGTGLGLAICHRIVDDHAGTIDLRTGAGTGTTVTVAFPRAARSAPRAAQRPAATE